jgi:hypothetical protein
MRGGIEAGGTLTDLKPSSFLARYLLFLFRNLNPLLIITKEPEK